MYETEFELSFLLPAAASMHWAQGEAQGIHKGSWPPQVHSQMMEAAK